MDFNDHVRKFPHITPEFLDWRRRNTDKWPREQSAEYIAAKQIPQKYPLWCEIPKFQRRIATFILAYLVVVTGWLFLFVLD